MVVVGGTRARLLRQEHDRWGEGFAARVALWIAGHNNKELSSSLVYDKGEQSMKHETRGASEKNGRV